MPTIEFNTTNSDGFVSCRPVLAKKYKPDWWGAMPANDINRGSVVEGTLKICPAMHDFLNIGWLLVSNYDIKVVHDKDLGTCKAIFDVAKNEQGVAIPSHPKEQFGTGKDYQFNYHTNNDEIYDAFKVRNSWSIKLPTGYSMMYLDPFLWQNKDFKAWNGVIDADKHFNFLTENSNIIMYPKHGNDFVIKKGTPLVQVIPFKRDEWTAEYNLKTSWEHYEEQSSLIHPEGHSSNREKIELGLGEYKKTSWSPKPKLFKDAKGGCPFGHDNPQSKNDEVQMEFDFK